MFYRMDPGDILALSGPRFMAMAYRVGAYQGALAARVASEAPEQPARAHSSGSAVQTVEGTREAISASSDLGGLIEW